MTKNQILFRPLELPCGVILKNRIAKSAMSDSLGDGTGHPTPEQIRLYQRWAHGGLAMSIIGEVQTSPDFIEKPGNLVLDSNATLTPFTALAKAGRENNSQLWLQLGHAGALAYAPTSEPKGPTALDLPGLACGELSVEEVQKLPDEFAATALLAKEAGFGGVQIHAAHGFLLSQFLSPLFNQRRDAFGGSISNRMRPLLEVIGACRAAVGPNFPIAVKLNSSDQLEGGLDNDDALMVVSALDQSSIDLLDISGGTYFPGAKAASDGGGRGLYFIKFAHEARRFTSKPIMLTGGFKTYHQAEEAVAGGAVDMVGLARAMVLEPNLPNLWQEGKISNLAFPRFAESPEGGITAWFTMRLTDIGTDSESQEPGDLRSAITEYEKRDSERTRVWLKHFRKIS
ncbi:MAG: NADH:flavin oxidoreductase/NADH oxidase family protein [Rhizobiaceae bacterium]